MLAFVKYTVSVYFSTMKNVTVTLDEKTAMWARKQAAARDMSLSRFIGELLQRNMGQAREYEQAMRRFFAEDAVALKEPQERYPSREALYDRGRLR